MGYEEHPVISVCTSTWGPTRTKRRSITLTCPPCSEQSTQPTWMLPCLAPGMICSRSKSLPKITTSQPDAYAYQETRREKGRHKKMILRSVQRELHERSHERRSSWSRCRSIKTCHHMTALEHRRIRLEFYTLFVWFSQEELHMSCDSLWLCLHHRRAKRQEHFLYWSTL